ncbi:MAG: hypothetical protein QM756_46900 [Polyangiaceae bacterium]
MLTWGPNNRLNPLSFNSVSKLYEGGVKADIIPRKLYGSIAGYYQQRDTAPDTNGNMARLNIKGAEASLRLQQSKNLAAGVNLSWVAPHYTYLVPSGFSPFGFYADNATVWGDRNALNQRKGQEYDAAGVPNYSATAYVDYRFDFGLGAELAGWLTSSWYTDISQSVKVPTQHNLDLRVYYWQPISGCRCLDHELHRATEFRERLGRFDHGVLAADATTQRAGQARFSLLSRRDTSHGDQTALVSDRPGRAGALGTRRALGHRLRPPQRARADHRQARLLRRAVGDGLR